MSSDIRQQQDDFLYFEKLNIMKFWLDIIGAKKRIQGFKSFIQFRVLIYHILF